MMFDRTPATGGDRKLAAPPTTQKLGDPGATQFDTPLTMSSGVRDQFLERRFRDVGQIDLEALANQGKIAYLSKSAPIDEFYEVSAAIPNVEAGTYRIRDEGAESPSVTVKKRGDGHAQLTETIDYIDPEEGMVDTIRSHGKLIGVVVKSRTTYKAKNHTDCLIHGDEVEGLGRFFDLKADSIESLDAFQNELGLSTEQEISPSYFEQRQEAGMSSRQLSVWKFHRQFEDYIMGVVSGTLTPIGFLSATVASGGSKSAMIIALLSAGLCDGLSDSVANSQSTQSGSRASVMDQAKLFAKTLTGKVAVPLTFVPMVLAAGSNTTITVVSSLWAAALLAGTASVQAIAHERSVPKAVGQILAWGGAAVGIGTALGNIVPPILERLL